MHRVARHENRVTGRDDVLLVIAFDTELALNYKDLMLPRVAVLRRVPTGLHHKVSHRKVGCRIITAHKHLHGHACDTVHDDILSLSGITSPNEHWHRVPASTIAGVLVLFALRVE